MKAGVSEGRSEYVGPVTVSVLRFGIQTIQVVRPTDPEQLLDDPAVLEWNRRDDYMPYWPHLWPGAYLLADFVMADSWRNREDDGNPTEALEIGCGLGLAGLAALARGCSVKFTDYDPGCFGFIERSAEENEFERARFACQVLDWRSLPETRYQIILGADVIYEHRLVPMVADVLERMLLPGGVGLLGSPYRVAAELFPGEVEKRGLVCQCEPRVVETEDGRRIEGTIYRVTRP